MITTSELKTLGKWKSIAALRTETYSSVDVYVRDIDSLHRLLPFTLVGALPKAGSRRLLDDAGREHRFSRASVILKDAPPAVFLDIPLAIGLLLFAAVLGAVAIVGSKMILRYLIGRARGPLQLERRADEPLRVCYLASDPGLATDYGGAAAHRNGVLKGLASLGCQVRIASPFPIPVKGSAPQIRLAHPRVLGALGFPDFAAGFLPLVGSFLSFWSGRKPVTDWQPHFIYQRQSNLDLSGALLARQLGRPFVLEYNGSLTWVARNWGGERMPLAKLADQIERANFELADLIIVVSKVLRDSLLEQGIPAGKMLVNPNGVDAEEFSPRSFAKQASRLREQLNIPPSRIVVGFIGSFGRWHGAEVLASAVRLVVRQRPDTHFVFVGQGITFPQVVNQIEEDEMLEHVTFTGTVQRKDVPHYLGLMDIPVSPHVPNPDGTAFFGSPTKVFEYMAMGRAIVASDLDQIGDVLKDGDSALLVQPGNVEELTKGIVRLVDDPQLRERLGRRAREEALRHHTWDQNAERALAALGAVLGEDLLTPNGSSSVTPNGAIAAAESRMPDGD